MNHSPELHPVVLYDDDCPLCRSLAALVAQRSGLRHIAWQEFQGTEAAQSILPAERLAAPADRLRVLVQHELIEGEAAWSYLIEHFSDLAGLEWLAARTGLRSPLARGAQAAGSFLRRLCRRCPQPGKKGAMP